MTTIGVIISLIALGFIAQAKWAGEAAAGYSTRGAGLSEDFEGASQATYPHYIQPYWNGEVTTDQARSGAKAGLAMSDTTEYFNGTCHDPYYAGTRRCSLPINARPDYWLTTSGWFRTMPGRENQYVEMDLRFAPFEAVDYIDGPPWASPHPATQPCSGDRLTVAYNGTEEGEEHAILQSGGSWFNDVAPAGDLDLSSGWVNFTVTVRHNLVSARIDDGVGHYVYWNNFTFGNLEQFDAFGDVLPFPGFICPLSEVHTHGPDNGSAYFDDFTLNGYDYGGPTRSSPRHRPSIGDPVDMASGNAAHSFADVSVASKGPQLGLTRTYNNLDSCTQYGVLGCDWSTNLDERLDESYDTVSWVRADGSAEAFVLEGGNYSAPPGSHDALVKNSGDGTFTTTDPSGVTKTYEATGTMTSVRDRFANGYDLRYHGDQDANGCPDPENCSALNGLISDVISTSGAKVTFDWQSVDGVESYRPDNLVLAGISTSNGRTVAYSYQHGRKDGRLISVAVDGRSVAGYDYNGFGILAAITDEAGVTSFRQSYDSAGRVSSNGDGRANTSTYDYDAGQGVFVDPMGARSSVAWGENGFKTRDTNAVGAATSYGYSERGDLTDIVDATNERTELEYNASGDQIRTTDPLNHTTTSEWHDDHQISSTTDPTGVTNDYSYDDSGALTSAGTTGPAGSSVFVPNPNGDGSVSATISPDSVISRTEYDSRGRPVRSIDAADRSSFTRYNPDGTVSETIAPSGGVTKTYYDAAKRPTSIVDPAGSTSTLAYDAAGNQASVTDPRGQTTRLGYDAAYNLYETSQTIESSQVVKADFTYDASNRLSTVTGPGSSGSSNYAYWPTGQIRTITDSDGAATNYEYSARGEVVSTTGPDGISSSYSYDSAGRLTQSANSTDGSVDFTYDDASRPVMATDASGNVNARIYDESGRPTIAVDISHRDIYDTETNIFGVGVSLSPGGRRNSQLQGRYEIAGESVVPSEVSEITYTYGPDGAPIQFESPQIVGESAITNTYEASTGRLSTQSGPGFVTDLGYDQAGQVAESTTTLVGGGAIGSQTRYDPAGNVTSRGGSTYTYDALGRMVSAHDGETGDDYVYAYDLASNRTKVTKNAATSPELTFTVADKIDTTQNPQFAYDAAGRLISDTTSVGDKRHYIWDGHGRLKGIDVYHDESGHYDNVRFTYDLVGRLAEKTTYLDLTYPADHLFYHYDGDRLISEEDMTGTVREYLYAGGEAPTAMRARQADGTYQNYFFVTNTHGDVVAVTDRDGNIVNRYAYGPWGEATRVSEQVHQPFRYAGYRYEDGFDLYYLRARWMDPNTGRFLSRDPLGASMHEFAQMNLYAYAAGAPSTNVDPDGYSPRSTDVVTFLSGVNSSKDTAQGWRDFLERQFPGSQALVYHYWLAPWMVAYDEPLVRALSAAYKSEVGGRRLYALGHSWGGVLAFKISARASLNVPLAITMGSPLYRKGFGANRHIRHWVAICSDSDEICDSQHLEQTRRNDPIYGADEVVIPGGIGHGGYHNSELIKKFIVAKMRQHGAR